MVRPRLRPDVRLRARRAANFIKSVYYKQYKLQGRT